MLQFGIRAHDFGRHDTQTLARLIGSHRPDSIQLALSKALSDAGNGGLSPGAARRIRDAFASRGVAVSVLGCYINPVHPDADERERGLRRFEEHLRFVRDLGCAVVGTETGSLNPDCSYHPDTRKGGAFETLLRSVERLTRFAEKTGAVVGLEAVADQHTVDSVEAMAELLRRVDSPALGVIWDPVNLIPAEGLVESQPAFFRRALDAFGDRIVAVHVKDFSMAGGRKGPPTPAGTGELDLESLFRMLAERKPWIDVLLENTKPDTVDETLALVRRIAETVTQ